MIPAAHIKLSELTKKVGDALKGAFGGENYWVIADVSSHLYTASKNYHRFELVEKAANSGDIVARMSANAWGAGSESIAAFERVTGQPFTSNIHVLVNVSVRYHPLYGLDLSLNAIDPNFTLGALEQQRQHTLRQLLLQNPGSIRKEGDEYRTRNNLLPLPAVIQRIALISSATSAGNEDFRHTLLSNQYGFSFFVDTYPAAVQGDKNAAQLVDRLIDVYNAYADGKKYDAVVITRGGGAQTDFIVFDNYYLCRAIARFPIPVITGIGHHKNQSIADLMAHTATKTPTKAAEFIIAHNKAFADKVANCQHNIIIHAQQHLHAHNHRFSQVRNSLQSHSVGIFSRQHRSLTQLGQSVIRSSATQLHQQRSKLKEHYSLMVSLSGTQLKDLHVQLQHLTGSLLLSGRRYVKSRQLQLEHLHTLIRLMAPESIVKKGFAIVKHRNKIIGNAHEVNSGDELELILSDALLKTTVNKKTPHHGSEFNL